MKNILLVYLILSGFFLDNFKDQKINLEFSFEIEDSTTYESIKDEMIKYSDASELSLHENNDEIILKTRNGLCYNYSIRLNADLVTYKYKGCKPRGKKTRKIFFDLLEKNRQIKKIRVN